MSDTGNLTVNILGSGGDSAIINTNMVESSSVTANVVTGARGAKGETGDTGPAGADAPSDHTLLTNIGTNTHAQIDTAISDSVSHIANTSNPHSVTKAQVGLSNVPNTDFTADVAANTAKISFDAVSSARLANTSGTNTGDQDLSGYSLTSHNHTGVYAPVLGADDNYVTDAEKVVIGNTSGTNTGDNATNTQYSGLAASKQDADATLTSLAAYNTNGLLTQTAADTFAGRTITGTANQITVTNGDGVSGNPTLSLPQNIHTGASPTFADLKLSTMGVSSKSITSISSGVFVLRGYDTSSQVFVSGGTASATATDGGTAYLRLDGATLNGNMEYGFGQAGTFRLYSVTTLSAFTKRLEVNGTTGLVSAGNTAPFTDSTYTLGTSSLYWSNTYTDRLYLNSTAYLDGGTAGALHAIGTLKSQHPTGNTIMYIEAAGGQNRAELQLKGHNASNDNDFFSLSIRTDFADAVCYVYDASAGAYHNMFYFDYLNDKITLLHTAISDGKNMSFGATTGTKIGTSTTQKLGFFNATPVVQPSATPANATDLATAVTLVNDLKSKLVTLGLIA